MAQRRIALFGALFGLVLPGLLPGTELRAAQASGRPNVVLILADDLGWTDLACQGSDFYETPHLDRLAAEGMRFTDAYANGPNCAPTRAALMSGQYGPRTGIYTVGSGARGKAENRKLVPVPNRTDLGLGVVTLAESLRAAGYATAHMGKWHLGGAKQGALPEDQGFELNVGGDHRGSPASYFHPYGREGRRIPGLTGGTEGEYLTDRLTDEAIAFLREPRDRPFFLYLPHYAVHTPIRSRADQQQRFAEKAPGVRQKNAAYAGMIASLDESAGRILAALEELGLDEDTLVVFTSDNGGLGGYRDAGVPGSPEITHNAPLRGGKGMLYEGGIRVPFLARWPGRVPSARTCAVPIATIDLYPTLLDLCGVDPPAGQPLDGESIAPLLLGGEDAPGRTSLFWHFPGYLESKGDGSTWRSTPAGAVRQGRYKLLEFFERNAIELYDLQEDPGETADLSAEQPAVASRLQAELRAWRAAVGARLPAGKAGGAGTPAEGPQEPADAGGTDRIGQYDYDRPDRTPATAVLADGAAYAPSIAALDDRLLACWLDYAHGAGDRVQFTEVRPDGSHAAVRTVLRGRLAAPTLTTDARGGLWLTWEAQDAPSEAWRIRAARIRGDGTLTGASDVSTGAGNAIRHRAAPHPAGGLWIAWQEDVGGQFDVRARFVEGETHGPAESVSSSPRGDWHPSIVVTPAGAVCVAWDAYDGESFDVQARWRRDGRWGARHAVAHGPAFQGRTQIAAGADGRTWVLWEEGAEAWGHVYRSNDKLWNNVTDGYGPVHRFRKLRLALLGENGSVRTTGRPVPMPAFAGAPGRHKKRAGVQDLGLFYERGALVVDARQRPWVVYRHYAEHQLGGPEPVVHHVEEGWKVYARCLQDSGWSALFRFALPQRDGMQRLSVTPWRRGIAAVWSTGRTDRDEDPLPHGVAFGAAQWDGQLGKLLTVDMPPQVADTAPVSRRDRPRAGGQQLFFGDLHRHTDLSLCFPFFDGSIDDAYRYAIEVAELDFLGITDHTRDIDRGDVQSLLWWRAAKEVTRHRLQGRFFPYFAYERSHRDTDHNVISLRDDMLRNFPPPLPEFWEEIDEDTFTIPHNPFIGRIWDHHDDAKRPLLEIYQGFRDLPEYAQSHAHEGLDHGHHFGFIASSDHLSTSASYAGVWGPEAGREPVFRAMQARRTFGATARIQLVFKAGKHWMGERIRAEQVPPFTFEVRGTAPIEWIDFYWDGERVERRAAAGRGPVASGSFEAPESGGGEHYAYVHVLQKDGNRAWSSPIWVAVD